MLTPSPVSDGEHKLRWVLYGIYGIIFTAAFDMNGGESVSFPSKNVVLNSTYGELPEAIETGHTFDGWFTERTGGGVVMTK